MLSSQLKQSVQLGLSLALGLGSLSNTAQAWQFRDLDAVAQPPAPIVNSADEASPGLLDLVPAPAAGSPRATDSEAAKSPLPQPVPEQTEQPVPNLQPVPDTHSVLKKDAAGDKSAEAVAAAKAKAANAASRQAIPEVDPEPVVASSQPTPVADQVEPPAGKPMAAFDGSKSATADASTVANSDAIYPAKFNQLQAGTSTAGEVAKAWGQPLRTVKHADGSSTLTYRFPSFKQVDVTIAEDIVSTILVHLPKPLPAEQVATELNLAEFTAVPIPDEYGEVLGQAYPERGLMFSFAEGGTGPRVTAILLEPVSAEMFRLRAQYDFDHQYTQSLADLAQAIRIDPKDAAAYWLQAVHLDTIGRTRDAVKSAQKAVRLKPTDATYRLTRARLFAKTNRHQTAISEVKAVINEIDMPNEVAAHAHLLMGDLRAMGPDANHQTALKHHLKAIDHGMKCVEDRRFAVRRSVKHCLVSAHMSVARDIAMGNFQRQSEVVPKWLLRATELADEYISDDQGDELLQMYIFRDTLASYAELQAGSFDVVLATDEAIETGRQLIASATDETYKIQIERLLAESLLHTSRISRSQGKHSEALQHANNALALLNDTADSWEQTSHDKYLEGQLYFVIGSIYAIKNEDHDEAVVWYNKARTTFVSSNFVSPLYSARGHGEMYVSMGLSFWQTGEQAKAVQITQTGAELMKDAVESGSLQLKAMSVPYGNLAAMHGKLGDSGKSAQYAKLVAKVESLNTKRR